MADWNYKKERNGIFKLAAGDLVFHWKQHLAVLLGIALSAAVLLGALMIGDSVRYSLKQHVYRRLGKTDYAFTGGERFVTAGLAEKIDKQLDGFCIPALRLEAIAVKDGGKVRVNHIQVLGIDERFWTLSREAVAFSHPQPGEAVVNQALAARLKAALGEEILFKIEKPGIMPVELPLLRSDEQTVSMRATVTAIADAAQLGDFNLEITQAVPLTLFLPLSRLQAATGIGDRINMLLVASGKSLQEVSGLLKSNFTLADAGLTLSVPDKSRYLILESDRIFLGDYTAKAAFRTDPAAAGSFSYFVNSFRFKDKLTPYSFITSLDSADGDMIINNWLAADLGAGPGDRITIQYFVQGAGNTLEERSAVFPVKAVIPVAAAAEEQALIPDFPGLTEVQNCRDWKPGIPLDLKRIRDKDEEYWNQYRAAPKAFIGLEKAQELWGNRYGNLTAVLYPKADHDPATLAADILDNLEPQALGITFRPVLAEGLAAGSRGVDFGSLFLGLSFFVIAVALFLTILLFQTTVENSAGEIGLYLAAGFKQGKVQLILFIRGLLLSLAGNLLGIFPAVVYNRAVLYGLKTIWNRAVGTSYLAADIRAETIALGLVVSTVISAFTLWLAIRKTVRRPIPELIRQGSQYHPADKDRKPRRSFFLAGCCLVITAGLLLLPVFYPGIDKAGIFFTAGSLVLAGFLAGGNGLLILLGKRQSAGRLTLAGAGFRNLIRRRKQTLLSTGLLAAGIFCVVSVGANRKNLPADVYDRSAGTGGYRLFVDFSVPILYNLRSQAGQKEAGLDSEVLSGTEFLSLRVQEAATASCLNLNYVRQPQLAGIDAAAQDRRGAFTFTATAPGVDKKHPWLSLEQEISPGVIPGVIDATVLTWNLGRSLGDTIAYTDERGREFSVKLVAALDDTILQGKILIAEQAFTERFPSLAGYRLLLVDAPASRLETVRPALFTALQNNGPEFRQAGTVLAEFHEVENTYLLIYLLLGGLGLIIGTTGFGIVVMRKVAETGNEPAILQALGFRFSGLLRYVLAENWLILVLGLLSGCVASFIALVPLYREAPGQSPFVFLFLLVLGMLFNGLFWILIFGISAVRHNIAAALRRE